MKRLKAFIACAAMMAVLVSAVIAGNYVTRSEAEAPSHKRSSITKEQMKDWDAPDEKVLDYYGIGRFRTKLPVVYLNTKGQQVLKEM